MATYRDFDWRLPETFNFGSDVVDVFAREPSRLALVSVDSSGTEQRYTFADIATRSDRLANVLADRGITKGERVIVMLPRIPAWQVSMIACFKLGAIAVPCIDMLTPADLRYRLDHCGASGVITTAANVAKIPDDARLRTRIAVGDAAGWTSFESATAAGDREFDPPSMGLEDPTVIFYTSGTTGKPKGVTHAARALFAWRYTARYWLDLRAGDLMWCTADTGWSKAGTSVLFGPWSWGIPVLFFDGPFDATRRLELLEKYRVTVFCAAATELRQLVLADVSGFDLSALRRTVSAGETLNPDVAARWEELTGAPCHEAYGQTESLMSVHNYPATPVKAGSAGLPLPGYEVAVLDDAGQPLPAGGVGVLAIKQPNPNMLLGYWAEPQRLAGQIVDNEEGQWFITGDAAHRDEEGYVFSHGRTDDIINSAGYRIGPAEVENALIEHPAVVECAAVASPDTDRGEIVKAFVVLAPGYEASNELASSIQDHCKQVTAPYKYPRAIAFVDELPKNVAGKLLRGELRRAEFAEP